MRAFSLAIQYGERVRIRDAAHFLNLINLADLYRIQGNLDRALNLLEKALFYQPEEEKALRLKEKILEMREKF
jgi:tetratricopeptide (TPR) repeat protein